MNWAWALGALLVALWGACGFHVARRVLSDQRIQSRANHVIAYVVFFFIWPVVPVWIVLEERKVKGGK